MQDSPIEPKHSAQMREFDTYENHEYEAKLASRMKLTLDMQTNSLSD